VGEGEPVKKNMPRGGIRRGGRKKSRKNINESMIMIGANAAGLSNKLDSFQRLISLFSPGVIFIQESKIKKEGSGKGRQFCNV
jgi:AAA15 family ATPase/GTPase